MRVWELVPSYWRSPIPPRRIEPVEITGTPERKLLGGEPVSIHSKSPKDEEMITISKYNPKWAEEFESIKSSLQEIVGDRALRIDHIGSTSVPGLGAKDIIDIQITVKELDDQIKQSLINAGYRYWGTIARDHVPQGEDDNPKLWEKFFFNPPDGQRPANIHIRVDGHPNQIYPLLFRDYLRAHPNSAKTIELIKREIARRHANDVDAYYDIKDPVYDLIWDAALEWSHNTGWKPQ